MNLTICEEDLTIYVNNKNIDFDYKIKENMEDYIKKLIIKINKIYKIKISGAYQVLIYQNKNYGLIIEMNKIEELEFFPDLIDLKINIFYDSEIFMELSDYFLINNYTNIYFYNDKYYLNIKEVSLKDQLYLSEFSKYIYGDNVRKIKNKFVLVK